MMINNTIPLNILQQDIQDLGIAAAPRAKRLTGDASGREYFRVHLAGASPDSMILMHFDPTQALVSDEFVGRSAARPKELPFITVQRFLARAGLPVPGILLDRVSQGRLWLDDLGDNTMYNMIQGIDRPGLVETYKNAIDLLVSFQLATFTRLDDFQSQISQKAFDQELLLWECHHFVEWLIEALHDTSVTGDLKTSLDAMFEEVVSGITAMPYIPVHRDFQSKNIMIHNDTYHIIDFQDMLMGPVVYDLVALLRDSYIELATDELDRLTAYYHQHALAAGLPVPAAMEEFRNLFTLQTLQRKMKDAGRFVFIDRVKHNDSFLQYIPATLRYVAAAFDRLPQYDDVRRELARIEERLAP